MKTHKLKVEAEYFEEIFEGRKRSEIRLNDRDYQKGDKIEIQIYAGNEKWKYLELEITHIHSGLGLKENYVCLSFEILNSETR